MTCKIHSKYLLGTLNTNFYHITDVLLICDNYHNPTHTYAVPQLVKPFLLKRNFIYIAKLGVTLEVKGGDSICTGYTVIDTLNVLFCNLGYRLLIPGYRNLKLLCFHFDTHSGCKQEIGCKQDFQYTLARLPREVYRRLV